MVIVTAHNSDGSPVVHPVSKRPLTYPGREEHRAYLSARKAWWPTGPEAKRINDPRWGWPPEGALLYLNGRPWKRAEYVPVFDEHGALTDTRLDWVDIARKVEHEERAKRVREMAVKLGVPAPAWATDGPWEEAAAEEHMAKAAERMEAVLDEVDAPKGRKR